MSGLVPGVALFTWLGKSIVDGVLLLPREQTVGLLIASVLLFGLIRWLRARRARSGPLRSLAWMKDRIKANE